MNDIMREVVNDHVPARDRLTCSCGWEAIDDMWVNHLRDVLTDAARRGEL